MKSDKVTIEEIAALEYCGGGYFRRPGPVGVKTDIIHAPELVKILLEMLNRRS